MSESSTVEIDFFRLEDRKLSDRRDIQGVISKINPEILKTAIASASANTSFVTDNSFSYSLQLQTPAVNTVEATATVAPMTIFYNGSVSVFDVTLDQAESIIKLAESVNSGSKSGESTLLVKSESNQNQGMCRVLGNDLPLSRKKSLKRFLEKRKERHVAISPYACSQGSTSSH
ncbi:protein TIFY 9-like [Bidens hawaiensis]|uniref:protein TIFY 9-like n=1 Tax=Bidens hawaiensis TaxID=980011 RepID=UPI00404AB6B7